MNSYIITGSGITVFFAEDNSQHTIPSSHARFADICKMAASGQFDQILAAIDVRAAVDKFLYTSANGRFAIEEGVLTFDGEQIHNSLADRMVDMAVAGIDLTAMENFMVNLYDNPSFRAVSELYGFLEVGSLPITPDGHFLAYKKIRDDYTDVHSGKFDNSIGTIVEMKRNQVNENRDITCAEGLHFCSYSYLREFGGQRVVVLKINPRDVVSIPSDYNNAKGRCCRYEVLREIEDWVDERIEGYVSSEGYYFDDEDEDEDEERCFDCLNDLEDCECNEDYDEDEDDFDDVMGTGYTFDRDTGEIDSDDEGEDDAYVGETEFDTQGFGDGNVTGSTYEELQIALDDPDTTSFTVTPPRMVIKATNTRNLERDTYNTIEEAHAETQVPVEYIQRVLDGTASKTMGYTFVYEPAGK